jgi:hypothetical protein
MSAWWSSLRDAQTARPRADLATALRQAQEALAYLYGDSLTEAVQAKALTKDEARRAANLDEVVGITDTCSAKTPLWHYADWTMYLRWSRHVGKNGPRLYSRLIESCRRNGQPRQTQVGSLRLVIDDPPVLSAAQARDVWNHVDYVLDRYRATPHERARITEALARKVLRPEPSPRQKATMALLAALSASTASRPPR